MSGVNKAMVLGNLGQDPELRYTQNGKAVVNLSIATSEQWKDQSGAKKEKTTWHRCVCFGRNAEVAGEYLKKGAKVFVEGRMEHSTYTDGNGVEKASFQIIVQFLQMVGSQQNDGQGQQRQSPQQNDGQGQQRENPQHDDFDDDIPF